MANSAQGTVRGACGPTVTNQSPSVCRCRFGPKQLIPTVALFASQERWSRAACTQQAHSPGLATQPATCTLLQARHTRKAIATESCNQWSQPRPHSLASATLPCLSPASATLPCLNLHWSSMPGGHAEVAKPPPCRLPIALATPAIQPTRARDMEAMAMVSGVAST